MKNAFLWLIIILVCWPGFAAIKNNNPIDSYHKQTWRVADGLPQNTIQAICEDHLGFIWISSDKGLSRFDGLRFENFNQENTAGFLTNKTRNLKIDHLNRLWICTFGGGLVCFENNKFKTFSTDNGLENNFVNDILISADQQIIISTDKGIYRFHQKTFVPIEIKGNTKQVGFTMLLQDEQKYIWANTTDNGLHVFKLKDNYLEPIQILFEDANIAALYSRKNNTLLISNSNLGIVEISHQSQTDFTIQMKTLNTDLQAEKFMEDGQGNLWIATYGRGIFIQQTNGEYFHLHSGNGLSGNAVLSLYEDSEGGIWIGTNGSGLNYFRRKKIITYTTENGLSTNNVYAIFQDSRGIVWVGSEGSGVNYKANDRFSFISTEHGLPSNTISSICEDKLGTIWFASFASGLIQYHPQQGILQTFTVKQGLVNNLVHNVFCDSRGTIWISTSFGALHRLENNRISVDKRLPIGLIDQIFEDSHHHLWLCTRGHGLYKLENNQIINYTKANGLADNNVRCILEDEHKNFWIGTSNGLSLFNGQIFQSIYKQDGLPDEEIYCLLKDNFQTIWMSTNRGIGKIPLAELYHYMGHRQSPLPLEKFGIDEGMLSEECNGGTQPAGIKSNDGRLWFPTTMGVAVIDPENIKPNSAIPKVILKNIKINQQIFSPTDTIVFGPGKGKVEINYTGINFAAPARIQFKYRLSGFDDDWQNAQFRRTAYYTNLPPGNYHFQVIACNSDKVWNKDGASLSFTLKPFFYQTTWFLLLCVITLAGSTYLTHRWRVKLLIKKEQVKYESAFLTKEKADELINQLLELMENKKPYLNPELSLESLAADLLIPRHYLSQLINWKLNQNFFDFINHYRIEEFKKLLQQPDAKDRKIINLAFEVGFNTQSSFNIAFKKHTGLTPTQYRKQEMN